ncbi:MAG TPA: family 2A encapsulin nanocompartment shell protein [Acidobacteriaceae bacterium]|nr:family 2A encapsulin nanocompartment shell protein [Acidobacteriaceae bacterium]
MADETHRALGDAAAKQLANITKTPPQLTAITPRWLVQLLSWVPVESGIYRVNKVRNDADIEVSCGSRDERALPETFVDYVEAPREYTLSAISTVVDVHTRVSDLFSHPHDQIREQLRLTVEKVKERQESELINNADYGLLNNVDPAFKVSPRGAAPTPDDMDELLSRIWKEPAFFLAHPRAIAAFGRECTFRGVPPPTATIFGSPFLTWRGIPLVPTDKLNIDGAGKTNILLLRTGERKQGVVGLFQPGLPGEQTPGLSVRFMGIDRNSIASYLVSLYCSAAVLAEDALGVLENVEVGQYHEYK